MERKMLVMVVLGAVLAAFLIEGALFAMEQNDA